jgi:hypothetical protein
LLGWRAVCDIQHHHALFTLWHPKIDLSSRT